MKINILFVSPICNKLSIIGLIILCSFTFTNAAQHIISGVPDYQQNDFSGNNDCAPTASACVLGYWDSNGYGNLISGLADYSTNPIGVTELVDFLKIDLDWTSEGGTLISNIPGGIEATANSRRGYSFSASNDSSVSWSDITTEINADKPFVFSILHPYYTSGDFWHAVAGVGYTEDEGGGGGIYYLNSIADSYVSSTEPEENYGSLSSFFAGKFHDGGDFNALIKFDLSSIDPGTNIGSAVLRLHCNMISGNDDVFVFLVANSWSEDNVTWNNKPGIDISAYTFHSPQASGETWEIDVTEHVRQWVNETSTNHGFYLTGRYAPVDNWVNFSSRESIDEASRPELVINAGWSDEIVIVHDNWTLYFPYDPDVWLNFNECTETYLTKVLPGGGTNGDPYEPDDTHDQANEIISGSPQNHSIVPATDEDWVWFSLSEESDVIIETSGPSGDTRMWLYDNGLNEIEYDDDSGTNNFSRIDRVCDVDSLAVGTYYIKIDEYENNNEISTYDIILTVTTCASTPGQLQFSSAKYTARENGGTATVTVDRVGGSDGAVTVSYEASDGTAWEEYDYDTANGTLNFSNGDISESFSVTIIDDDLIEEDEFINLSLSNPTNGATLGGQETSVLFISDNEPDLNDDGRVNLSDFSIFADGWLRICDVSNWCEGADFDSK